MTERNIAKLITFYDQIGIDRGILDNVYRDQ